MSRVFPLILLLVVLAGGIAGWRSISRYQPPDSSGEERLRQRAAEYYRASRIFDFTTMAQMYSPARQVADADELLKKAEDTQLMFNALDSESQKNLRISADSIDPAALTVNINGDWAETSGTCSYPVENQTLEVGLDKMIWVRTGGDWWIYTWKWPEIAAYGNPSEEAMQLLRKRKIAEARQLEDDWRELRDSGNQQADPAADLSEPETESDQTSGEPVNTGETTL